MLCKRCMTVMEAGTTYEKRNSDDRPSARRFYECNKCHDKIYTKESNFQECLNTELDKYKK